MNKILMFLILLELITAPGMAQSLKMATTTSVEACGLLDVLLPAFEESTGIKIRAIAVGTGQALKLAQNGDVDLVLVHAPKLELEFVKEGFGINRKTVFYNDFVVVGPEPDPAQIKNFKKVTQAFKKIATNKCIFISRGDNSGTHIKELQIWNKINLSPQGSWYMETGQGMGATLMIADEKRGYCLVDRATFISLKEKVDLVILFEKDPLLINPYSVIAVNPTRHPHVKYKQAKSFIDWISSKSGKNVITQFRKNQTKLFNCGIPYPEF